MNNQGLAVARPQGTTLAQIRADELAYRFIDRYHCSKSEGENRSWISYWMDIVVCIAALVLQCWGQRREQKPTHATAAKASSYQEDSVQPVASRLVHAERAMSFVMNAPIWDSVNKCRNS